MDNPDPSAHPNASTSRALGNIALAGLLVFSIVAVAVQVLRSDLDWMDAPLSFYLLDAYGHWLQAAYIVLASALAALGAGYYLALRDERGSAAPWLLFVCAGIGLCATALAHSNLPGGAPTFEGWLHGTAAQSAFLCVTVATLLQSWRLRRARRHCLPRDRPGKNCSSWWREARRGSAHERRTSARKPRNHRGVGSATRRTRS